MEVARRASFNISNEDIAEAKKTLLELDEQWKYTSKLFHTMKTLGTKHH